MYVGITRARATLARQHAARGASAAARRVAGVPSRFIAEMKLDEAGRARDPRAKLKALRDAAARRAEAAKAERGAALTRPCGRLDSAAAPRTLARWRSPPHPSNNPEGAHVGTRHRSGGNRGGAARGQREGREPREAERLRRRSRVAILATFLGICNVKDDNVVQAMLAAQAEVIDQWSLLPGAQHPRGGDAGEPSSELDGSQRAAASTRPSSPRDRRGDHALQRRWRRARTSRRKSRRRWPRPRQVSATTSSTTRTTSSTWPRRRSRSRIALLAITALTHVWWLFWLAMLPSALRHGDRPGAACSACRSTRTS